MRQNLILSYILVISALLFLSNCAYSGTPSNTTQTQSMAATPANTIIPASTPQLEPIDLIIGGTGDIMCHKIQLEDAQYTAKDFEGVKYYFDHNFKYIKSALQYPDLMIGNLETVFASEGFAGYSGWPYFNTPDELAYALKDAGFDVLTTANNHCLDRGKEGLVRTISVLDEVGIHHTGTFATKESANTPLIINVKGVKIGILSSSYGVQNINTLSKDEQSYMLSISEDSYLENEVDELKKGGAQIIVASMHWGYEKYYDIYKNQDTHAALLVKAGVDIIFGHHPHILQPIEYLEVTLDDGTINSAVVCWSLGNFLANTNTSIEQIGAISYVYLSFDPVTENVTIEKCQALPTYIYNTLTYYYDFHILPSGVSLEEMNITDFTPLDNMADKLAASYTTAVSSITANYVEFISKVPIR